MRHAFVGFRSIPGAALRGASRRGVAPGRRLAARACLALVCLALGSACRSTAGGPRATEEQPAAPAPIAAVPVAAVPVAAVPVAPGTASESRPLRVATWNMEWLAAAEGRGTLPRSAADYARLRDYAARLDADVIALQEVQGAEAAAKVFDPERYAFHFSTRGNAQLTGFAYRRQLNVTQNADYRELGFRHLRHGTDLTVHVGAQDLRLLNVHLKSGCFEGELQGGSCEALSRQVPLLERWIDARAAEGTAFVVLGDFNRRLFKTEADPLWQAWDDADPPESDLWSPTQSYRARCWDSRHPHPIDHILLSRTATAWAQRDSFRELLYDAADRRYRQKLSDHCPLSLVLDIPLGPQALPLPSVAVGAASGAPLGGEAPPLGSPTIKANISRSGHRFYHLPACPNYDAVTIREGEGDKRFRTEQQARAAGFVLAPDCP